MTTNKIDKEWGNLGLCDDGFRAYPESLIKLQKELGLSDAECWFILKLKFLKQHRTIPYGRNLGLSPNRLTRTKKRLVSLGLLIDKTSKPNPANEFKVVPDYDLTPLHERLAELDCRREVEQLASSVPIPPPTSVVQLSEFVIETSRKFLLQKLIPSDFSHGDPRCAPVHRFVKKLKVSTIEMAAGRVDCKGIDKSDEIIFAEAIADDLVQTLFKNKATAPQQPKPRPSFTTPTAQA